LRKQNVREEELHTWISTTIGRLASTTTAAAHAAAAAAAERSFSSAAGSVIVAKPLRVISNSPTSSVLPNLNEKQHVVTSVCISVAQRFHRTEGVPVSEDEETGHP
jgi:hypothetical protein